MPITLDNVEQQAIVLALTEQIDRLSVALATSSIKDGELRYARLTKERAYLISLRNRIHNYEGPGESA